MAENKSDLIIETPSPTFLNLDDEIKADIENFISKWRTENKGGKINITEAVKKKYKDNSEAIEYFEALKHARKDGTLPTKKYKQKQPEAIAREEFAEELRIFIKKYFKNNCNIDQNNKIFLLDQHYNLPPYFWMRMNKDVLPKIITTTSGPEKKILELRAWQLAKGIMIKYETELGDRLQKTVFSDLRHVCNTIIQFLNKYILTTYKELMEKAKQEVINKKKNEKKVEEELKINQDSTIKKRGGGAKGVQQVKFDTTGLL